jgi:hypothetical protein
MFLPELHAHEPGCVDDMTRSPTFSLLFECVGRCLEETGDRETDPLSASVAMWAGVHGLATLWLDGPLSQHVPADRFERLTDEVVAVLNRGVAAPSPRPLSG